MSDNKRILNKLNEVQKKICMSEKNIILTACPGSGKTRTITHRLAYISDKYKGSKLLNIAITYTNRAANEIENRIENMGIDTFNIWTGTIHQFCMNFIIRPYAMYHNKLSKGYKIIDEYIKSTYYKQIAKELGIEYIRIEDIYDLENVQQEYKSKLNQNKEIDFDMILQYSLELLCLNEFIAENISYIIRSIHVDEYQDTNENQYLILSKIIKANLNINILFVGDINQSIYGNLGGIAKNIDEIKKLFPVAFEEITLSECYRSTQRLVDYYSNYEVMKTNAYSVAQHKEKKGTIKYNNSITTDELHIKISEIIAKSINAGIKEHEICIVAPQWYLIYSIANKLKTLMPNNNFDAPDISPFKYDPMNPFYLITKLLFTKDSKFFSLRRKEANEILNIFKEDYKLYISNSINKLDILKVINSIKIFNSDAIRTVEITIDEILKLLNVDKEPQILENFVKFMEKTKERFEKNSLSNNYIDIEKSFKEKTGIVISTIHGVKGEEYNTIISYGILNGYLPHWDYIINKDKSTRIRETKKMLYVLTSRAKENIYLFSETGRKTKNGKDYIPTDELRNLMYSYD